MDDSDTNSNLIASLLKPQAYPNLTTNIKLIETHISWIILTGEFAYKIKKPVNFGFVDFSTLEKRKFYCNKELELNQKLSKDLYIKVVGIAGSVDSPILESVTENDTKQDNTNKNQTNNNVIEYTLQMQQFEQE